MKCWNESELQAIEAYANKVLAGASYYSQCKLAQKALGRSFEAVRAKMKAAVARLKSL